MNKAKSLQVKSHLDTFHFLVLMILGIGFICLSLINIGGKVGYSTDAYLSAPSRPTALMLKQKKIILSDILNLDKILYPSYSMKGDNIGRLLIPVLNQELQIRQGTSVDELKKGVGHFPQSVLPGEENNCVLSGHRDTFFAQIDKLKIGDQLIVQTSKGAFNYEISRIRIVAKDDETVILPADHAVLTLSTCYPFYVVDNAPDRYILTADLVINNKAQV